MFEIDINNKAILSAKSFVNKISGEMREERQVKNKKHIKNH